MVRFAREYLLPASGLPADTLLGVICLIMFPPGLVSLY